MLVPYIFKRIISMIPIVLGVSFLIFSMMYLIPGDPAQQMLGQSATPEAVEELREDLGLSYLFISHDLNVIYQLCDRVMVMEKGRIVEMGDTAELYSAPQHPYTQKLLASLRDDD